MCLLMNPFHKIGTQCTSRFTHIEPQGLILALSRERIKKAITLPLIRKNVKRMKYTAFMKSKVVFFAFIIKMQCPIKEFY